MANSDIGRLGLAGLRPPHLELGKYPWVVLAPLGAYLVALHGSLQHEALHGHPTRSAVVNELLVFLPVSLWFPIAATRHCI